MPKAVRKKAPSKARKKKAPLYVPTKPERTNLLFLRLPLTPHPKGRPRFFARGKFVSVYTDAKTKAYEDEVRRLCIAAMDGDAQYSGPLLVDMVFIMPCPKSKAKARHHVSRPDVDNLAKAVLDGMNGVAYHDDAQICTLHAAKEYAPLGDGPYITVAIHPISS